MGCSGYLLIAALLLLFQGTLGSYEWMVHRKQQVVTHDELLRDRPKQGWYRVNGSALDLSAALIKNRTIDPDIAYIPVRSSGKVTETNQPAFLFLRTTNKALVERASRSAKGGKPPVGGKPRIGLEVRSVEGMIRSGIAIGTANRRDLEQYGPPFARDYVVLEDGERPSPIVAALKQVGGLAALLLAALFWWSERRDKQPTVTSPDVLQSSPPG